MTSRASSSSFLAVVLASVVVGCGSSDRPAIRAVSSHTAQELNARHGRFDGEDPPFNARTHFAAGQLAETQGAAGAALGQYQAALKLDPEHLPSLYRTALIFSNARAYPQAIAAWERLIERSPDDAVAHSNLAFCHELAGHPDAAERAYRQGIAIDPKNEPCRVNYGLMLARAGRTNEAIVQLQAVLSEAQVQYNLGSTYESMGRPELAKACYRKAVELDGNGAARQRLAALE
jgi:tetratricopeptide (TPR) repeat protein